MLFIASAGVAVFTASYLPQLIASIYWDRTNEKAVLLSMIAGIVSYVIIWPIEKIGKISLFGLKAIPSIAWAAVIATIVLIIGCYVFSKKPHEVEAWNTLKPKIFQAEKRYGEWPGDYIYPIIALVVTVVFTIWFMWYFI
jgi:Na+/proline symporter